MADGGHQYNNIVSGGRGGAYPGSFKVHAKGFLWKKSSGGKVVDVSKDDVKSISWTKLPKSYQMSIRLRAGSTVKFSGFLESDVAILNTFISSNMGVTPENKPLSVSGRNWGEVELQGNTLSFNVGGKQAFEVCLADVSQTQVQGKNDVMMEFHMDDTANEKNTLMELSFYVPSTNTTFVKEDETPAQILCDKILLMADVGQAGGEAVAAFEDVSVLTPRGRCLVELHLSSLKLLGATTDFKIQYTSVARLFVLPRTAQSSTYVVITLDPPIRKGQTFYPHIVLQYPSEEIAEVTPSMSDELFNTKYKDKLAAEYKGPSFEVFVEILRGLSGAGVTKPGSKFRSSQEGFAVRAALKAEEGLLYPLEKSFFFLPKPPTLIIQEEIEYVEFERHGVTISSKNFDLIIRMKSQQEYQFRNISRNDYHNLFKFISEKGLKILNFQTQGTTAVAEALQGADDRIDPHLENIRNARDAGVADESDEEDEDFVAEKDDEGSPTDDSGDDSGDSEGEQPISSPRSQEKQPAKKEKRTMEASSSKRKETEHPKKKVKKDPNAPKRPSPAFLFYSAAERERSSSKISPTELGERWKALSNEEKEPYEAQARASKEAYRKQKERYKASGGGPAADASD